MLEPQHLATPPRVSAQVSESPAAIALTPLVRSTTLTGVARGLVIEPLPSWPSALRPQYLAPPQLVSAQVCW